MAIRTFTSELDSISILSVSRCSGMPKKITSANARPNAYPDSEIVKAEICDAICVTSVPIRYSH